LGLDLLICGHNNCFADLSWLINKCLSHSWWLVVVLGGDRKLSDYFRRPEAEPAALGAAEGRAMVPGDDVVFLVLFWVISG
jgi:hypothetical protein